MAINRGLGYSPRSRFRGLNHLGVSCHWDNAERADTSSRLFGAYPGEMSEEATKQIAKLFRWVQRSTVAAEVTFSAVSAPLRPLERHAPLIGATMAIRGPPVWLTVCSALTDREAVVGRFVKVSSRYW